MHTLHTKSKGASSQADKNVKCDRQTSHMTDLCY